MPLRKRIGIMGGVGYWSALRDLNPLLCAMLRSVIPRTPSAQ